MDGFGLDSALRIVEILSILGGGVVVIFRLGRSTEKMQAVVQMHADYAERQSGEIADIKKQVQKLSDVITQLAVQGTRLDMIDKRVDELRRGEGFIAGPRGVEREY